MPPKKRPPKSIQVEISGDVKDAAVIVGDANVINTVSVSSEKFPQKNDHRSVREWWHDVLRNYGYYSCYAIFLALPSDKEIIRYLTDYGRELDLISGENCLVIALSKTDFRRSGFDKEIQSGRKKVAIS